MATKGTTKGGKGIATARQAAEQQGPDAAALNLACERLEATISDYGQVNLQVNPLDVLIDSKAFVALLIERGLCTAEDWQRARAQARLETLQTVLASLEAQAAAAPKGPRLVTPPAPGKLAIVKH